MLDITAFYDQTILNEGFLNTARQRLSVKEMARSIGYETSSGVSASTHLALDVQNGARARRVDTGADRSAGSEHSNGGRAAADLRDRRARHGTHGVERTRGQAVSASGVDFEQVRDPRERQAARSRRRGESWCWYSPASRTLSAGGDTGHRRGLRPGDHLHQARLEPRRELLRPADDLRVQGRGDRIRRQCPGLAIFALPRQSGSISDSRRTPKFRPPIVTNGRTLRFTYPARHWRDSPPTPPFSRIRRPSSRPRPSFSR